MIPLRLPILLAISGALLACTSNKPDASSPWVVVLDEAATRNLAAKRAEQLCEQYPERLDEASALSFLDETTVRHLVVGPGQANRQKASALAAELSKKRSLKLRVLDTTSLKIVSEEEDFASGAPEDAERLERLAALLPEPIGTELDSFILWTRPEQPGRSPLKPFGYGCPSRWWSDFTELGWQSSAQAVYRGKQSSDPAKVYFFVGKAQKDGGGEALKRVYNFLLDYVGPTEEEWEQASKKKARRRMKRRRMKKTKKPKKAKPIEMVLKDPPGPKPFVLPWGSGEVVTVERVAFQKKEKIRTDTPVRTALIARTPDRQGVLMVLYDPASSDLVADLLAPRTLGENPGLAYTPYVAGFWQVLPEVALEEENLSYLGMQRLIRTFDRKRRKNPQIKRLGNKRVFLAGYRSKGRALWQISWADLENQAAAEKLYDSAYVEPRKEMIQRLLRTRRRVRYDVGVSFKEIGDALGWHLRGAHAGALQELYFQRKGVVWLLQAIERGPTRMGPEGLHARAELLQIWDQPAENP